MSAAGTNGDGRALGWAVVGCGWVSRDWTLPGLRDAGNCRVVALCDPHEDRLAEAAAIVPQDAPSRHTELEAALNAPGVEAVYVATPNHVHAEIAKACARAGKHVLCEKPMAPSVEEAEAMVAACAEAGVHYATAFDQRHHAAHRMLRRMIAEGRFGTVTQCRVHYACWLPIDWVPEDNWRIDLAKAGGGSMIDLAPHGLDLLETLLDEPLTDLKALLQRRVHGYPVDDGAVLLARFGSGALATLQVGYNCPETFPRRRLEIVGTKAMAIATNTMGQTPGGELTLIDGETGKAERLDLIDDRSPFQVQVERFAAAILRHEPFPFPPERDVALVRRFAEVNIQDA